VSATPSTITEGTWVMVQLRDQCDGERPHKPDEDGMCGTITSIERAGLVVGTVGR
jgi:hypothetical protein